MSSFTNDSGSSKQPKAHRLKTQILTLDDITSTMRQLSISSALLFPVGLNNSNCEKDISVVLLVMPTNIFFPIFGDKIDRGNGNDAELTPNQLAAFVQHEHQYRSTQYERLMFPGLQIDPVCREVAVNGKLLSLPPTEFELLWFLAKHPRQVFTRAHLLKCVWRYDYTGGESTVTVHIRRLRKKIEPNPANPTYIHTIWGVGYKFEVPD